MRKLLLPLLSLSVFFTACESGQDAGGDHEAHTHDTAVVQQTQDTGLQLKPIAEKGGISIAFFPPSPDFPDARLTQVSPSEVILPAGKTLFEYRIANFELTKQTEAAAKDHCNNSEKGQHIHHILNNEPYTAHYTDTFTKDLKPGRYVSLSFLSRSYHESLKHKNAYQLTEFVVINPKGGKVPPAKFSQRALSGQHLFYSRPKGEYKGKDTRIILLDFYLVNTKLAGNGNKVRATINGNEFILTEWAPYAIMGLPLGENTIRLELIDKSGKLVPGPYNQVERKITLSA